MSARDLHVVWGVNQWVLVETRTKSVELQVATKEEFTALLAQVGLMPDEAKAVAGEQWKQRPRDAATTAARSDESLRRATGTSQLVLGLLFLAFIAMFVVYRIGWL